METLFEKICEFEEKIKSSRLKYLLAKKANNTKIVKRFIMIGFVVALMILLSYLQKAPLSTIRIITVSLTVVWLVSMLANLARIPQSLRPMYEDLISKRKAFVKNEILPEMLSSLEKEGFTLNEDFEKNLLSWIGYQTDWISDGRLICYQITDDRSLLIKKDGVTYHVLYWAYWTGLFITPDNLSKTSFVVRTCNFVWMISALSVEIGILNKITYGGRYFYRPFF